MGGLGDELPLWCEGLIQEVKYLLSRVSRRVMQVRSSVPRLSVDDSVT